MARPRSQVWNRGTFSGTLHLHLLLRPTFGYLP